MVQQMPNRLRSIIVGVLILIAYGVLVSGITDSPIAVMTADIISGVAVIGIAVLMYPLFRASDRVMPAAYLVLKWVEGLLMIAAGIFYFIPSTRGYRSITYDGIHLYVFIISGAIFYVLLFRRRLIPRFISIWGMAGIGTLTVSSILSLTGHPLTFLDYFLVLIITNEIFLAIWLFVRKLDLTHISSVST